MPPVLPFPDGPARDVDQVIERMHLLDDWLPQGDGFWWFNKLYLRMTLAIRTALHESRFQNPEFVVSWDVAFAQLYFQAVRLASSGSAELPRAWVPLRDARSRRGILPLQFAMAGMNAHINRDLPWSLLAACTQFQLPPDDAGAVNQDFLEVNRILASTEDAAKRDFSTGFVRMLDWLFGRVDDELALWSIRRARDAAWENTQLLWLRRESPAEQRLHMGIVDGMVGFAGRGLLRPLFTLSSLSQLSLVRPAASPLPVL
jgi:Family of unknown function (DUF5995)